MIRTLIKGGGDLRGRQLRTTPSKLVDRPMHAAAAHGGALEHPKAVSEDADQVRGDRFDVPARAQARCRQLRIVQFLEQACYLAPLVGDRGEYHFTVH